MATRTVDPVRPELRSLHPYVPGKPVEVLERELGITGAIKLASNENPLGPSPLAVEAMTRMLPGVNRYPEGSSYFLREALSRHVGVEADSIVVGSGSNDLIDVLCRILLEPGTEAVMSDPSFLMFPIAVQVAGGTVVRVPGRDWHHDPDAMLKAITDRTRIAYFANPDNPTGTMVRKRDLDRWFAAVPDRVLTILDEAYFEYVTDPEYPDGRTYLRAGKNVAVLRTFSKVYALAGLRVGYGLFTPEMASWVNRVRLPFNVTTVGQVAAEASLRDTEQVPKSRALNDAGLEFLTRELRGLGLDVTPSWANFVMAGFPRPAGEMARALERLGVIIRPLAGFRLPPPYARISVGTREENERLLEAIRRSL